MAVFTLSAAMSGVKLNVNIWISGKGDGVGVAGNNCETMEFFVVERR